MKFRNKYVQQNVIFKVLHNVLLLSVEKHTVIVGLRPLCLKPCASSTDEDWKYLCLMTSG